MPQNLFETVCAFLNRNGGHIFLGISDKGEIIGISDEKIQNMKKRYNFLLTDAKWNDKICLVAEAGKENF